MWKHKPVTFSANDNLTANPETGVVPHDCGHLLYKHSVFNGCLASSLSLPAPIGHKNGSNLLNIAVLKDPSSSIAVCLCEILLDFSS